MKTFCIIALLCLSAFATESSMSIENQLKALQKTGWGRVATQFIQLQLKLGGPLDDLQTAFAQLFNDLTFQRDLEMQEWGLKTSDHNTLHNSIQDRIDTAKSDIASSTRELDNVLHPLKESLETQLDNDHKLVTKTESDIATANAERATGNNEYAVAVDEHNDAIDAIRECIALVSSLKNEAGFVQIQKSQNHLKKLAKHMTHKTEWSEMVKVMLELAQNFSDQSNVDRVLVMLNEVLNSVIGSLANLHQDEEDSVAAYTTFISICETTLTQCHQRIQENTAAHKECCDKIDQTEDFRDVRTVDQGVAEDDMQVETDRWNKETDIHNTVLAEIDDQLAAIDEIIELVTSTPMSAVTMERMNQ